MVEDFSMGDWVRRGGDQEGLPHLQIYNFVGASNTIALICQSIKEARIMIIY